MDKSSFIPEVCGFDPFRDISTVVPDDCIDLHAAFDTGFIPDNVVIGDSDYDNNENPRSIIGRPSNEFEAIHLMQTMKDLSSSSIGSKDDS